MESISTVVNTALEINSAAEQLTGIEPILIVSVIIFVSFLGKLTSLRDRVGKYSKPVMILVTVLVSVLLALFAIPHETTSQIVRNGFVLACVSALVRNFCKPLFAATKSYIYEKFEKYTGKVVEREQ